MIILRWIGIALCGAVAAAALQAFGRREAALVCEITCGVVLLTQIFAQVASALDNLPAWAQSGGLDDGLAALLFKVAGIAVATELAAQLCRDSGAGALAQKIELGGKVVILCAAMPMMQALCEGMLSLLG